MKKWGWIRERGSWIGHVYEYFIAPFQSSFVLISVYSLFSLFARHSIKEHFLLIHGQSIMHVIWIIGQWSDSNGIDRIPGERQDEEDEALIGSLSLLLTVFVLSLILLRLIDVKWSIGEKSSYYLVVLTSLWTDDSVGVRLSRLTGGWMVAVDPEQPIFRESKSCFVAKTHAVCDSF